ncbi:MAG: hypothetical protein IKP26_08205 [Clostridia bacterium]|nr:hypothetical protein [Clostridia bacterium]
MQLSDIHKIKGYYNDLVNAKEPLLLKKSMSLQVFYLKAICNYIIYGTSFSEFAGYGFYSKKHKEKRTYMTRRHMFRFFDRYNPLELRERIGDKELATKYYSEFLSREQITKQDGFDRFVEFSSRYKEVFIKKKVGWGGDGARKDRLSSEVDVERVWDSLSGEEVVEPIVENHDIIKAIYPNSLNTIKVTVLQTAQGPKIVTAIIRFGNQTIVDNVHSGGMAAGINIATGQIETLAMDKHFQRYSQHPETNHQIKGLVLPEWEKIKALAVRASTVTPRLRYTSWDIALTQNGPIMIEGNWDAEFYMEQTLYNQGNRKRFVDMLEGRA